MKYIPNCLTAIRIIGAFFLIFLAPFTTSFYIVYLICGVTDVLDGAIARATGNSTEFGSKLDSIADLWFYLVMMIKILPTLLKSLPKWMWVFISITVIIRVISYITAAIKFKKFASVHTYLNKATGVSIFFVPIVFPLDTSLIYSVLTAVMAFLASTEELAIHLIRKTYDSKIKSIIMVHR